MPLYLINMIICVCGASLCLYTLISKHADTTRWRRLFFVCLMGLAFTIALVTSTVNKQHILIENVLSRLAALLAVWAAVAEMRYSDRKFYCVKIGGKCGRNNRRGGSSEN